MISPRSLLLAISCLLPTLAFAAPLPRDSPRTIVLTGDSLPPSRHTDLRKDDSALGSLYLAPRNKYQTLISTPLPAEGDPLSVWVRYRNLALQMKTRVNGETTPFPWNWQRNAKSFDWRLVGTFPRAQLGDSIWFLNDTKFDSSSGIDALLITADTSWQPSTSTKTSSPTQKPPAENPDAPDAANATVQTKVALPDEPSEPGSATVTIDWAKTSPPISPFIYSLNNFRGNNPERMASPAWHDGHRYMGARLQRIHNAGLVRSLFDPATGTWDYDKIRAALDASRPPEGVERMFNINGWPDSFDADQDGRLDPDRIPDYARLCADLIRFVNLDLKAGIRYWEITNEKDFAYWRKPRKDNQPDIPALARLYNETAAAMRTVDPSARFGGPAACSPLPLPPLVEFVRLTADQLDFFSVHHYATGSPDEPDRVIYEKAFLMARDIADLAAALRSALPGKPLDIFLDEFNICYSWRIPETRMTDHKGAVFDALSLIAYSRVPGLTGTNAWNDQDRVYGKMDNEGNLRPAAHVYHYFNQFLIGTPADTTTTAPRAVVPLAVTGPGTPAFVLVNRTNAPQTVTLQQTSPLPPRESAGNNETPETPAAPPAWQTASIDATGHHAPAPASPFAAPITLPPHSVTFYWLN